MTKQELLDFLNGEEEQIGDKIVLIKDGVAYSEGEIVNVSKADLSEMLNRLASKC